MFFAVDEDDGFVELCTGADVEAASAGPNVNERATTELKTATSRLDCIGSKLLSGASIASLLIKQIVVQFTPNTETGLQSQSLFDQIWAKNLLGLEHDLLEDLVDLQIKHF